MEFEVSRFHFLRCVTMVLCLLFAAANGYARNTAGADYAPQSGQDGKEVIWMPTVHELVAMMLDLAKVTAADFVIDLGSGDGRTVIAAAKRGAKALGVEYNPDLVEFARRAATAAGVGANAGFEQADIFEYDFSKASVLTLFLLPDINVKLRPKILDMKPGTRIVSNTFEMGDWDPDQTKRLTEYSASYTTAHLWIVPAKVNGTWKLDDGQISFTQKYQKITGTLTAKEQKLKLTGKLDGDSISFTAGGTEYTGTVSGKTISGTRSGGGAWRATR
jgi:SAM-dependent methyltransferase